MSSPQKNCSPSTAPSTGHVVYTNVHMDAHSLASPHPHQPPVQVPCSLPLLGEDEGTPALHASLPAPQLLTLVSKPCDGCTSILCKWPTAPWQGSWFWHPSARLHSRPRMEKEGHCGYCSPTWSVSPPLQIILILIFKLTHNYSHLLIKVCL